MSCPPTQTGHAGEQDPSDERSPCDRRRWLVFLACLLVLLVLSRKLHTDLQGGGPGIQDLMGDPPRFDGHPWSGAVVPIHEVRSDRVIVVDNGRRLELLGVMPDARVGAWISYHARLDQGARALRVQRYHVHHTRFHKIWISTLAALLILAYWLGRHTLVTVDGKRYLAARDA